ncbi:MAG: heteromeric transposase endonuclease subunit TnsA [Rhodospirillaceae bacterium]|nr:heteromeric transposase endonuclease subunit TnsA [Rhodospirillaceae bacterium]
MPVREIPISSRSLTGRHASGRGAGSIGYESSLERDFISLMLFDPQVTNIEEQPVRIDYRDSTGSQRHYTPDFLVQRTAGAAILIEVKPAKFVTADLDDKFNAARTFARSRGWTFEVWTEREIRTPRLENAKFLLPYRANAPADKICDRLLAALGETTSATITGLLEDTCGNDDERAIALSALWHLLATGVVHARLEEVLKPDSEIRLMQRRLS